MTTIIWLLANIALPLSLVLIAALLLMWPQCCMASRARARLTRRLRSCTPGGSDQTGQEAPSGSCPDGVERRDTRPPAATPSSAGTDAAPPQTVCARRALSVGASDHPADAPTTQTPVGAGRPPHWHTPAPTGPRTVTP